MRQTARIDVRDGCVGVRFLVRRAVGAGHDARNPTLSGFPDAVPQRPFAVTGTVRGCLRFVAPYIIYDFTAGWTHKIFVMNVPGTVKTVPYKAPVNPICREGYILPVGPLRGRLPDTRTYYGQPLQIDAPPKRGRRGRRPLQDDLRTYPPSFMPALFAAWHTPADVPRGTSAGLFCWKNPFFIPSVCAIIDASGLKAAKKRKNRGGTAWQKSSQ